MTAIDSVPKDLVINALILGTLSIVTGMVFVLDTCLSNRRDDKKSKLPKNTRYGDIPRTTTTAAETVDSMKIKHGGHTNGVHENGVHTNGMQTANGMHAANGMYTANGVHTNGVHLNGKHANGVHKNGKHANGVHTNGVHKNAEYSNGMVQKWDAVEKKQNGLLQTAIDGGRSVETRNESVQTSLATDAGDEETGDRVQYGRKHLDNRGFGAHRHADWYDTDMDLQKMKKLEINVQHPEESPDYRRRYAFLYMVVGLSLVLPSHHKIWFYSFDSYTAHNVLKTIALKKICVI